MRSYFTYGRIIKRGFLGIVVFLSFFVVHNVGAQTIDYIKICTQPGGGGVEVGDTTITADQPLTLYAAGYSNSTGYVSDATVNWSTTGTLDYKTATGKSFIFDPIQVGSGTIIAHHATATDDTTGTITINPGALNTFTLIGIPSSVQAGESFSSGVTVRAYDADGNVKTDYTGIVSWSSTDGSPYPAALPTDDGSGWNNGQKTFSGSSFILYNTLSQTITVTDNTNPSISEESGSITVTPAFLASFTLSGVPSSIQAGQQFPSPGNDITVTAYDGYGNQKTDYTGTVLWSSTDVSPYPAALPTDDGTGWSNGQKTFSGSSFILYNTPSQTITVTDNTNPSISEESGSITVTPASLASFTLSGVPSSVQAGQQFTSNNVVTAYDVYGNP